MIKTKLLHLHLALSFVFHFSYFSQLLMNSTHTLTFSHEVVEQERKTLGIAFLKNKFDLPNLNQSLQLSPISGLIFALPFNTLSLLSVVVYHKGNDPCEQPPIVLSSSVE